MIPSTAQLSVEMSKVEWQDQDKRRWMQSRDKAYDYYKGRTEVYTKGYFSDSLNKKIVCPTNWLVKNHESSWINGNHFPPGWINIDNKN